MVSHWVIKVDELGLPYYLKPFGDLHSDSYLHAGANWRRWRERAMRLERPLFFGMGDYTELNSTGERKIVLEEDLHDAEKLKRWSYYEDELRRFYEEVEFMKGRTIGLIEGGHFGRFYDNSTTTERLCQLLNDGVPEKKHCKYLGAFALVRLTFVFKKYSCTVDICAHHGLGASRLLGGSLNRVQYLAEGVIADIYLMNHDHAIVAGIGNRIELCEMPDGELDVVSVEPTFMRGGGMMKAYIPRRPSYLAKKAKTPRALRLGTIALTPQMGDSARRGFHVEITPILGDVPGK